MKAIDWFERSYKAEGLNAQRRYPNEELIRFIGRNYPEIVDDRTALDIGCGTGANLKFLRQRGFKVYGLDASQTAIDLCAQMVPQAKLVCASMVHPPYYNESLDLVTDVFSSYCLNDEEFREYLKRVGWLLKRGGRFFIYTPSCQVGEPYKNNDYEFRFMSPEQLDSLFSENGLKTEYLEKVGRSYSNRTEYFEWVVAEGVK